MNGNEVGVDATGPETTGMATVKGPTSPLVACAGVAAGHSAVKARTQASRTAWPSHTRGRAMFLPPSAADAGLSLAESLALPVAACQDTRLLVSHRRGDRPLGCSWRRWDDFQVYVVGSITDVYRGGHVHL